MALGKDICNHCKEKAAPNAKVCETRQVLFDVWKPPFLILPVGLPGAGTDKDPALFRAYFARARMVLSLAGM